MRRFYFSFFIALLSNNDFICVIAVLVNYHEFGVIKIRILDSLPNTQIFQRVFIGYPRCRMFLQIINGVSLHDFSVDFIGVGETDNTP